MYIFLLSLPYGSVSQAPENCPTHWPEGMQLAALIHHELRIFNVFNLFQSVRSFVRTLVHGIKNEYLIGRHNDVTANMTTLAV